MSVYLLFVASSQHRLRGGGVSRYTACMRLRVVSWNVRSAEQGASELALLRGLSPHVILLQDITCSMAQTMRQDDCMAGVLDTWNDDKSGTARRRRGGCLIAVTYPWRLTLRTRPPGSATDGRILCGTAVCGDTALTLFSCYAPTNAGVARTGRTAFFTALAQELAITPTPLILGMDANGPRIDHPDLARSVWWTPEEAAVLGSGTPTRDALRLWYQEHPDEFRKRCRYYPHGPLADSYHRGRRGRFLRSRYDSIRFSPDIRVLDVRYLYDDAIHAGSDHAVVVADVELR